MIKCRVKNYSDLVTVVGSMPEVHVGSGLVKGIGPKFAGKIVKQFGKNTLDVIEEDPDKLLEIPGIGKTRVERIKKSWVKIDE